VYGEYSCDYDEERSEDHCIEGMGKLIESELIVKVIFARARGRS